jgi:Zn-dependent protease
MIAHETAHVFMAWARSLHVKQAGINLRGFYVRREHGAPWDNLLIAAAGPCMHLFLACVAWQFESWRSAAYGNAFLGIFYLLPIPSSDGRHILEAIAAIRFGKRSKAR